MFPEREIKFVSTASRALNFGWAPYKAREVWAGAVAKHSLRPRALVAARQGQRRDAVKNKASTATLSQQGGAAEKINRQMCKASV
jgi:hypothetical protein